MALKKEVADQIKDLLQKNPHGLSITEIVATVKINRNTAGRYLENLLVSGKVEMRRFGMAKIYTISQRVPVSAVLSVSSDLVLQLDRFMRIIFANEPFCTLVETDSKHLLGKNIEFTPVALVFDELFVGLIERIREGVTGNVWSGEIELRSKGILVFCRIAPTVFEDGSRGVSVILEDITQRKRAERALLDSEAKLRSVSENSPDVIMMVNPDMDIIYINRMLALNPDDVIGKSVFDFIPREFHPGAAACSEYVLTTGKKANYSTEYHSAKRGTIFIEATVGPVLQDGKVTALVINARDVTERKKAEQNLREGEERLRLLLNSTEDLIFMQDPEGRYLYFNVSEKYGVSGKEMLGLTPYDLHDKESADRIVERVKYVAKTGLTLREETPLVWKGQALWFSDSLSPARDAHGTITAVVTVSQNITERKRTEIALRESEDMYRSLAEASTDLIFVIGRDDAVEYVNSFASSLVNKPVDQIIGNPRSLLFPGEVARNQKVALERIFDTGIPFRSEGTLTFSGQKYWFDHFLIPLKDANGRVRSVLGISRDITERKRVEKTLLESEERYRQLVEISPDAVIIHQDGKITFVNPAAISMFGAKNSHEILGRDVLDIIHPDFRDSVRENIEKDLSGETTPSIELNLLRFDGTTIVAEGRGVKTIVDGKPAIQVAIRDITGRKRSENALRRNEDL
jgi:PAS domain S-box-containing protein